jgi:hypothetical protein
MSSLSWKTRRSAYLAASSGDQQRFATFPFLCHAAHNARAVYLGILLLHLVFIAAKSSAISR